MPNLVSITRSSLQILGKTQTWVFPNSRFLVNPEIVIIVIIMNQCYNYVIINENCHNSRTSDDNDMKLGPVSKLDRRNKTTSKKFDVDVISENYDVIVIFWILGQFGAIRRPDSGHRVCKSYVFSNRNLLSYKNSKQNLKISNTALTLLL